MADWRKSGDETRIDGGVLSANTVRANALEIGSRNITLTGVQFEYDKPSANQVSWTAGQIRWVNDAGATTSTGVAAGNATWTSGILYIYWAKGAGTLAATTTCGTVLSHAEVQPTLGIAQRSKWGIAWLAEALRQVEGAVMPGAAFVAGLRVAAIWSAGAVIALSACGLWVDPRK